MFKMKFGLFSIFLFVVLYEVRTAPVEIKEEKSKRRETTRETLELEDALKRLAGEDKQYYPGLGAKPVPQVDGLEEDPAIKPHQLPVLEDESEQESIEEKPVELESNEDQPSQEITSQEQNDKPSPEQEITPQEEDDKPSQEMASQEEDNNEEEDMNQQKEDEYTQDSYNSNSNEETDFYPDTENDYKNELSSYYPQQGLYDNNDNYRSNYAQYAEDGDVDGDGENEDYVLQDVLEMMERHPELWSKIIQAKGELNQEAYDEEQNQGNGEDENPALMDKMNSAPTDNLSPQMTNMYDDTDEDALDRMKVLQQYEKLQQLYGDEEAHVVAKKKGYGPAADFEAYNQAFNGPGEGSGEEQYYQNDLKQQLEDEQRLQNNLKNGKPVFKMHLM